MDRRWGALYVLVLLAAAFFVLILVADRLEVEPECHGGPILCPQVSPQGGDNNGG